MRSGGNNIGPLRLLFASAVIVSHSPGTIENNGAHEPLRMLFHNISLGDVAVDAFFLLSGYLITQSMLRSRSVGTFLGRRVLRIYPAFILAYVVSCLLVAALWTGALHLTAWRIPLLQAPPQFGPYLYTNLPMWTIAYEFRCYLLIALLGATGLLAARRTMLFATMAAFALFLMANHPSLIWRLQDYEAPLAMDMTVGQPWLTMRLVTIFALGCIAFLYRETLSARMNGFRAIACLILATASLRYTPIAEPGVVLFGGLALYWLAFQADLGRLARINDRWDISYGTYLYGWPIAYALKKLDPTMGVFAFTAATLVLAWLAGALSWFGLEKWMPMLFGTKQSVRTPTIS